MLFYDRYLYLVPSSGVTTEARGLARATSVTTDVAGGSRGPMDTHSRLLFMLYPPFHPRIHYTIPLLPQIVALLIPTMVCVVVESPLPPVLFYCRWRM